MSRLEPRAFSVCDSAQEDVYSVEAQEESGNKDGDGRGAAAMQGTRCTAS